MLTSPRRRPGFSLIELMVTLTLLGLLLMLGLPSFSAMVKNTQVRTVADALQNGIRLARAEALRLNRPTVFSLTNATPGLNAAAAIGGVNWSIQTVPIASSGDSASFVQGGALRDVASGVAIAGTNPSTGAVNALCFNSNGRLAAPATLAAPPNASCTAQPTTFTVSQSPPADRPLNVTVSIGGQVRMCDPARGSVSAAAPDGC